MGVVYRAAQMDLGRTVALKLIAPDYAHDGPFRERFKRESRLAASIDHPNVIPVYEAGEADGSLFISMRWVEGPDLRTMIKRGGGMAPRQAARITEQVGAALDAAHDRGLVHRDVKPANVLVAAGRSEHVYLTDFGLVKRTKTDSDVTASGEFVGTLDYIAPEQIEGKPSASSDVYSLGCVLFQSLTGRVPFDKPTEIAKIAAHLHEPPPCPSELAPGVPTPFDEVVRRAMAKDCEERFATAGELGQAAVDAASASEDATTRSVKPDAATALLPRDGGRTRRLRRPLLWAIGAVMLIAAAAAALATAGVFDGGGSGDPKSSSSGPLRAGTLVKARGEPGVYLVQAGAKFPISPQERSVFFAGERKKVRVVSNGTLQRVPDIPREGSRIKPYASSLAWLVHKKQRGPLSPENGVGAVVIPAHGLAQIPLRGGAHPTSLSATGPLEVEEAQSFRVAARARSSAGVPRGRCLFFRITRDDLLERANVPTRKGRCAAILSIQNLPSARYSVHFYGYKGWGNPTASTKRVHVLQRP